MHTCRMGVMLCSFLLILLNIKLARAKAFKEDSYGYEGNPEYYYPGTTPYPPYGALNYAPQPNPYYTPEVNGQPIYVPAISGSVSHLNEYLDNYYKKYYDYTRSWAPVTPAPYGYDQAKESGYYGNREASNNMVASNPDQAYEADVNRNYHSVPAGSYPKYELKKAEKGYLDLKDENYKKPLVETKKEKPEKHLPDVPAKKHDLIPPKKAEKGYLDLKDENYKKPLVETKKEKPEKHFPDVPAKKHDLKPPKKVSVPKKNYSSNVKNAKEQLSDSDYVPDEMDIEKLSDDYSADDYDYVPELIDGEKLSEDYSPDDYDPEVIDVEKLLDDDDYDPEVIDVQELSNDDDSPDDDDYDPEVIDVEKFSDEDSSPDDFALGMVEGNELSDDYSPDILDVVSLKEKGDEDYQSNTEILKEDEHDTFTKDKTKVKSDKKKVKPGSDIYKDSAVIKSVEKNKHKKPSKKYDAGNNSNKPGKENIKAGPKFPENLDKTYMDDKKVSNDHSNIKVDKGSQKIKVDKKGSHKIKTNEKGSQNIKIKSTKKPESKDIYLTDKYDTPKEVVKSLQSDSLDDDYTPEVVDTVKEELSDDYSPEVLDIVNLKKNKFYETNKDILKGDPDEDEQESFTKKDKTKSGEVKNKKKVKQSSDVYQVDTAVKKTGGQKLPAKKYEIVKQNDKHEKGNIKAISKPFPENDEIYKKPNINSNAKGHKNSQKPKTKLPAKPESKHEYQPDKQDFDKDKVMVIKGKNIDVMSGKESLPVEDFSESEFSEDKPADESNGDTSINTDLEPIDLSAELEGLNSGSGSVENINSSSDIDSLRSLAALNSNIWSLIFNPNAERNKPKRCNTRNNETGHCVYIQNCDVPNVATSLEQLLKNACVIDDVFIGICCPEFPVQSVMVQWDEMPSNSDKLMEDETDHNAEDCGIRSDEASKAQSWPWKAPLVSMSNGKIFCGGVIINENYILTAAHCTTKIPRNQILVRLGQHDDSSGEDFAVVEIKRHAQYNPRTMNNDIALLKLGRRIMHDDHTNAVCLPSDESGDDDDDDHDGEKAILLGWHGSFGKISKKDEILKVISNEACRRQLGMSVATSILCTEARNESERTCNADSGAPLVVDDDGKYEVIGILSWNRNDCDPRFPSTFSRVSKYVGWIEMHAV